MIYNDPIVVTFAQKLNEESLQDLPPYLLSYNHIFLPSEAVHHLFPDLMLPISLLRDIIRAIQSSYITIVSHSNAKLLYGHNMKYIFENTKGRQAARDFLYK